MENKNVELSIITINFNNRDGLSKTIKSVREQTVSDFEYIIIDGGSTDGSWDVINDNADGIDYWVSEKDNGIYHAMNKGTKASHGLYCLFLNSGDALVDSRVIERLLALDLSADIVSGNQKRSDGRLVKPPKRITMKYFVFHSLPHASTLIRRTLLIDNPYDERFGICGDWRFFIQVLIYKNVTYQKISQYISLFGVSGISTTEDKRSDRRKYEMQLCRDIIPIRIEEDYKFTRFLLIWKWRFEKLISWF